MEERRTSKTQPSGWQKAFWWLVVALVVLVVVFAAGPGTTTANAQDRIITYTYDAAGRLIQADYGGGNVIDYIYDVGGNLLSVSMTGAAAGEVSCGALNIVLTPFGIRIYLDGIDISQLPPGTLEVCGISIDYAISLASIKSITHDATSPLKAGDTLTVTLKGKTRGAATFDLGTLAAGISMEETSRGTYIGTYIVKEGDNIKEAIITGHLEVAGATTSKEAVLPVTIDAIPPITTDNAPTTWQTSTVTVTLTPSDTGSGIAGTYYSINQGALTEGTEAIISEEGVNTLSYFSVDNAGNTEATRTKLIKIDRTPPGATITSPANGDILTSTRTTIAGSVTDTDITSGTLIINGTSTPLDILKGSFEAIITLSYGENTIAVSIPDESGNIGSDTVVVERLAAQSDLRDIRVYPNPFKPYNGSSNSGVIFDNLTEDVTIKIFNISGELVDELSGITSRAEWDAKNKDGKEVSSGIYIYLITDREGRKKAGKLAIVR